MLDLLLIAIALGQKLCELQLGLDLFVPSSCEHMIRPFDFTQRTRGFPLYYSFYIKLSFEKMGMRRLLFFFPMLWKACLVKVMASLAWLLLSSMREKTSKTKKNLQAQKSFVNSFDQGLLSSFLIFSLPPYL